MAAENELPVDPARRRRRRRALLALIPALLASAFLADQLAFKGAELEAPALARGPIAKRSFKAVKHGVTAPIGVSRPFKGQGGPEDSGPWIEERGDQQGWYLGDSAPIDGFAHSGFTLPPRFGGVSGGGSGGFGGGSGGGGGGGGGGSIVTCVQPGSEGTASTLSALPELCVSKTSTDPAKELVDEPPVHTVVALPTSRDTDPIVGGPSLPAQPTVPVSAVPEPESWLMMIAGFLMIGWAIRSRKLGKPALAAGRV